VHDLTILMPCLNEAETLLACIKNAKSWISTSNLTVEILVSDNGSSDGSIAIATAEGARVINVVERGYGSALYHGIHAAGGKWIIMADSDDSYDFSKLDLFIAELEQGADFVIGNRFLGGIEEGAMPWKNRYIGNPVLSLIGRSLFGLGVRDFHCGLRAITKSAFEKLDLRSSGMEFASEMVIRAALENMRIAEVPVKLRKDGRSTGPHLRPWRDGWRHLRFMLLYSPNWLFLAPSTILLTVACLIYLVLLTGPVSLFDVVFDVHTLFYAQAGIVLGFLGISTGLLSKLFAAREGLIKDDELFVAAKSSRGLEYGSILGALMMIVGFALGISALQAWQMIGFGELGYGELMRTISLSTLLILLGGVTVLSSLMVGFLTIPLRRDAIDVSPEPQ
jgi:glycosyltransferase involved in cell wall biosynthesis